MLTLKTAIGIAIRGEDLEFVCLKRTLGGVSEPETMRLEKYRAMRPADAGRAYRQFLERCGLSATNAMVALPRRQVLLRVITLPAEAKHNLAKAIEYQVDTLHPFEEGGVDYDFAVLRQDEGRLQVAVVMVDKGTAQEHYEWFSQAGIAIAGFTASAAALYAEIHAQAPVIAVAANGAEAEILGVSADGVVSKQVLAAQVEREVALCRAELRMSPEAEPRLVENPNVALATARAALERRPFAVNVLPPERRVFRSPWMYAPTYALGGMAALLLMALALRGTVQDQLYLNRLNGEIRQLEPRVAFIDRLDTQHRKALDRLLLLRSLRAETSVKAQALAELTRILPPAVSLSEVDSRDGLVIIAGQAEAAGGLLGTLGSSPWFRNAEFLAAINKTNEGKDLFRIRARLTGGPQ
jgi:Tfp pilus assembly protein PilN